MVFFLFVCGPEKYGAETEQRECAYAECKSEAFQKPKLERSVEAEHSFVFPGDEAKTDVE